MPDHIESGSSPRKQRPHAGEPTRPAIGLLEHEDAAHDDQQVRKDWNILQNLYSKLGEHVQPYLALAIQNERESITADAWAHAAFDLYRNLPNFTPKNANIDLIEPKLFKEKFTAIIGESADDVCEKELRLLTANVSRSVVNAWVTDLNHHYYSGMCLNRFLLRKDARENFLGRALAPFQFNSPDFEDNIICAMRDFSFSSLPRPEQRYSIVELPENLRIVLAEQQVEGLGDYDTLTVYREDDLPKDIKKMMSYETQSVDVNAPNSEIRTNSFLLRLANLWWNEIGSQIEESGSTKLDEYALPYGAPYVPFFIKTRALLKRELGIDHLEDAVIAAYMLEFKRIIATNSDGEGLALSNGIHVKQDDDGGLSVTRYSGTKHLPLLARSKVVLLQSFRQAGIMNGSNALSF